MAIPREQSTARHNFPEAMLRICPGYGMADGGEPVARAGALRRPREQSTARHNFPEAMLRICPGYGWQMAVNLQPGQALCAAPGSRVQCGIISRRRCCASVRATGWQMAVNL
ncbi:hypothetical protein [Klebsiella oxytoca]|uniref:hypothetical protein n=1 Tax=Klebsiella oxytoca TaxID=571 RepID=UPI0021E77852|nr:hypothetical protein [Klebsiella oxytoca]